MKMMSPGKIHLKKDQMLFSDKPKGRSTQQTFLTWISKIVTFGRRNIIAESSEIQIIKEQSKSINRWVNLNKH